MNKLVFILGLTLGASALVAACGDTAINEGAEPSGGAGGGAGKTNGGTGATDPGSCTQHPDCKSFGDCQTLEDLRASECGNDDYTMYVTLCGGTNVEFTGAATASSWLFDANGQPIGGFYEDESSCSEWGTTCGPAGPSKPLCSNECVTYNTCKAWASDYDCLATLDAFSDYCHQGMELERQASGCGGTIVRTVRGLPDATWTFDAAGKLVATSSLGDQNDCFLWGTECDKPPIGEPEPLCGMGGEGGMGGQGVAGAGVGGGAGGAAGAGGSD